MTRDEAVREMTAICGFVRNQDALALTFLSTTQERLEKNGEFLPWFLLTENASKQTIVGEERVGLPLRFLRENEEDALWYQNAGVWSPLDKMHLDDMRRLYPDGYVAPGGDTIPRAYSVDRSYFRIRPLCTTSFPLRMIFFEADTPMAQSIENRWLTHASKWIVNEAGLLLASALQHTDAYKHFLSESAKGKQDVYVVSEERKHVNRVYYVDN